MHALVTLGSSTSGIPVAEYPYVYAWGNNAKRATLKGRRCRVTVRGRMNSCEIEFEDGSREIVSRNAIRGKQGVGATKQGSLC